MKNKLKFLIIATLSTFALSNTMVGAMKTYTKRKITLNKNNNIKNNKNTSILFHPPLDMK